MFVKLEPNYLPEFEVNLPHNCKMPSKKCTISQLKTAKLTEIGLSGDLLKHI